MFFGCGYAALWGSLEIKSAKGNLPWRPDEFDEIYSALDYKVKGLSNQSKTYGLGAPLILVHRPAGLTAQDAQKDYLPRVQQVFGATLILRLNQSVCGLIDESSVISSTVEQLHPKIYTCQSLPDNSLFRDQFVYSWHKASENLKKLISGH